MSQPFASLAVRPGLEPMEAKSAERLPVGPDWSFEPKWDGFRCLAFRDGDEIELQAKSGKPLTRFSRKWPRGCCRWGRGASSWTAS